MMLMQTVEAPVVTFLRHQGHWEGEDLTWSSVQEHVRECVGMTAPQLVKVLSEMRQTDGDAPRDFANKFADVAKEAQVT